MFDYWDYEFESCWGHGYSSFLFVLCCIGSCLCDKLVTCSEETYSACVSICMWNLKRGGLGPIWVVRPRKEKGTDKLSSGYFPGIWVLKADVSEHCVGSIFNRWWSSHFTTCWRWNRHSVPKRQLLILRRRGDTQKTIYHYYNTAKA